MAFATIKMLGKAAASATKAAAITAVDVTKKTVSELNQIPTEIKCSNCPLNVPVPPNIFDWRCPTVACQSRGTTHAPTVKVCPDCMAPRPAAEPRSVTCVTCGHATVVPASNARKHAATAGRAVQGAAVAVKDTAVHTYQDLKAAPTTIACSGCTTPLEVPPTLFDWSCEKVDCLKTNPAAATTCEQCGTAKGKQAERAIICAVCQAKTVVPFSNASKHLKTASKATKDFASSASTSVKSAFSHARASPVHFNCSTCNELLQVPGYWVCKGCSAQNPREPTPAALEEAKAAHAAGAPPGGVPVEGKPHLEGEAAVGADEKKGLLGESKEAKHDYSKCFQCGVAKEAEMVQCGKCHQPTVVPSSNFGNKLKSTGSTIGRSFTKIWYDVSSTPYIKCDQCAATIKVPVPPAAPTPTAGSGAAAAAAATPVPGPAPPISVTCEACHKTFTASVPPGGGPISAAPAKA